jgi:hypothetical protein
MPSGTFSSVQADIKAGKPAPVYLIVGDDERGKDEVVHLFDALVPDDIRPFNVCPRRIPIRRRSWRSPKRIRCSAIDGWSSSRAARSG